MIVGFSILFGIYFLCLVALIIGFRKLKRFSPKNIHPDTSFTIIIPFRNESGNLPILLKSISSLDYPPKLFNVLFVNDDSNDNSEEIIQKSIEESNVSIELIQNIRVSNSPKKDAISTGVKHSKSEWILTTDADCELPKNWLKTFDAFIQSKHENNHNPVMICAPVIYKSNGSFIETFQELDGLSLQTVTMGSFGLNNPLLNNGANLAYRKDAFEQVNGFSGNNHIASGDDIFLLEKVKKAYPKQVTFLKSKESAVYTTPQTSWSQLINQRIRWASKTSKQKNPSSIVLGLIVFLTNILFLAAPVLMILDQDYLTIYLLLILSKVLIDYIIIQQSAMSLKVNISFWKFLQLPFVYSLLILIVVIKSFKGSYSWKDRQFHQ